MNNQNKLIVILITGLTLRLILLAYFWDMPLTIVDETHYQSIAENIYNHKEFALRSDPPSSMRPPLYPAFLSIIYYITGGVDLNVVRVIQIVLSLATVYMVFLLGRRLFSEKAGLLASLIFAVYPSFLFFTHFLLTEVLFTLLFTLFIWYFLLFIDKRLHRSIFLAGFFLGLCALTRSIMFPFLPVALLFILFFCKSAFDKKIKFLILLTIGYAVVVAPWAFRNTMLHKSLVIVNTMGGFNLYMGNYEHTPKDRAWAAVNVTGRKAWYYGHEHELEGLTEAEKSKWCTENAKKYILNHKLLTLKRSVIKAANFWGLERSVIGGIIAGHYPAFQKKIYLIPVTLAIFAVYAALIISSIFGFVYYFTTKKFEILFIIILIGYFTAMHSIVFGHSRYHLSLISILAIFSAQALLNLRKIWENRSCWNFRISILLSIVFVIIWVREIIFIEGVRSVNSIS